MSIIKSLEWRYATKKFDDKRIDAAIFDQLLRALQLAPSSFGLQPYTFVIVEDEKLRSRVGAASYNQPQIMEADKLIIVAAKTNINEKTIADFITLAASERNVPRESLVQRESYIRNVVLARTLDERTEWAKKQAYLAVGILVAAAAEAGVDMCPMEGVEADKVDEIFKFGDKGLTTTMLLTLGYRSSQDITSTLFKVRKSKTDLFHFV